MKLFVLTIALCFCFGLLSHRVLSEEGRGVQRAILPPRGWNSYDSFSWIISEEEFLQNAGIISQKLLPHGYEYVVVDFLWYRRKVPGAYLDSLGYDVIDEWGRMVPDPKRWPSSQGGKGFTDIAKKVHDMGLKFGIHIMRGISTQAVNANTPILDITTGAAYEEMGRKWYAKDIGITDRPCRWMPCGFMSVNTELGAGKAFLKSLHQQYADWGVDFVKHDCVFGDDLDINEITVVSEVLKQLRSPIVYSLSPGTSVTPDMANAVTGLANMYRITGDDWDSWQDVVSHFDITRDLSAAEMIGGPGLCGKSWPDLDMLPLGWLTDAGSNDGPHRFSNLNLDEQKTQMTLWAIAKSPLMFGGDLRKLDHTTYNIITQSTLLDINSFSTNNMEFPYVNSSISTSGGSASSNDIENIEQIFTRKSRKILSGVRKSVSKSILGLTSCTDSRAIGWVENRDQSSVRRRICWREKSRSKYQAPFCLYKRESILEQGEKEDQWRLLESGSNETELCLDASPLRKLSSYEFSRDSFSPCREDSNQAWDLNLNGTLSNSYSGQCATVNPAQDNFDSSGVRSWIATGSGEVYVALFNLNSKMTTMSISISDIGKVLPGYLNKIPSKIRQVWSGQEYDGRDTGSFSTGVEAHGCALLVLSFD